MLRVWGFGACGLFGAQGSGFEGFQFRAPSVSVRAPEIGISGLGRFRVWGIYIYIYIDRYR